MLESAGTISRLKGMLHLVGAGGQPLVQSVVDLINRGQKIQAAVDGLPMLQALASG
jgi:hypothetical protein